MGAALQLRFHPGSGHIYYVTALQFVGLIFRSTRQPNWLLSTSGGMKGR